MAVCKLRKEAFSYIRSDFLVCLGFIIATLVIYWPVKDYEFINYDDDAYIYENTYVLDGLNYNSIKWSFTTTHVCNWHPITWISHILDTQLYGMNAGGHHLTNVFFHLLNTLLLFFFFRKITGALWKSGFVAALFALHPLHVESVAWVAERKDVLSTFFWMLTLWSYACYVEHRSLKMYLTVLLFFILGLMSKPMVVTLPFVLILLDYWPLNRFGRRATNPPIFQASNPSIYLIIEKIPFFVFAAVSSIITYLVQQNCGAVNALDDWPLYVRITSAFVAYIGYIGKMIWPFHLAIFYPHPGALPMFQAAVACVLLLSISVVAVRTAKLYPYCVVGWLWYLGTLVPVIGLVKVGSQAMADRYTYIPIIGLFIIIAWGVPDLVARFRYSKVGLAITAAIFILSLMVVAWFQAQHWQDSIALFKHAIQVTEHNDLAHFNLGNALMAKGKIDEAVDHYYKAIYIKPDDPLTYTNLGIALFAKGKTDEAVNKYTKALQIDFNLPEAHNSMGNALYAQGKFKKAMDSYAEALRIKPDSFQAHNNLGLVLYATGNVDKAIFHYTEALRIKPDYAETYNNLGAALIKKGMIDKAVVIFEEALRIDPGNTISRNNLNKCLKQQKDEQ